MAKYAPTNIFTLVPIDLSNSNEHQSIMKELFSLDSDRQIKWLDIPHYDAKIIYAFDSDKFNALPTIYKYLILLPSLSEHNKVIIEYNLIKNCALFVVGEGENLICANSFEVTDFGSVIYYLLEILNKSQINPKQTIVNIYGSVASADIERMESYVKRVKICLVDKETK